MIQEAFGDGTGLVNITYLQQEKQLEQSHNNITRDVVDGNLSSCLMEIY